MKRLFATAAAIVCAAYAPAPAQEKPAPSYTEILNAFPYRNLGPFRAGAWVSALAVPETPAKAHQRTFYAGARTGGVWRTTNNGTTFEPVTDGVGIASVGAIAVAPSDAAQVWVGTGDNSVTRSAYYGNGVYKSTDGGDTWKNTGLADTQHIARIVVHPTNPDIVWVAALGHLYTPNAERGVFKTSDGGRTWSKVLFVNDTTGAVDLVIDHRNPSVLYAAMYEARRFPWKIADGGPSSGIFKSSDGGAHWEKLAGGLPEGPLGRIGLDICRRNPDVLYAVVDNFNNGANNRPIGGQVYRTDDAGRSWRKASADSDDVSRKAGYSFNQLRVDPNNPEKVYITGSNMIASSDGGKTWAGLGGGGGGRGGRGGRGPVAEWPFRRAFGDFRSLWIDPEDSDRMIATSDGGVFLSYDGGKTCDHLPGLKLGEVYALGVDMDSPYHVYAGLQDHENWRGPVDGWSGAVNIDDWVTTGIGDGMYNEPDPTGRWLYNTQEFGHLARVDLVERTRTVIEPPRRPAGQPFYRFNWTAPVRISPHDHNTIYYGAQVLLRSKDRGDHWEEISPDLTTNNPDKITTVGTSIQHCTIVTIAESPAQGGVIWVGTDDGKVQVTRDGGAHWTDATAKVAAAGGPEDAWVTRVYPSATAPGAAYVTKSRRRSDDFQPYVFRTTDFGATWSKLVAGLPATAGANAIVEDPVNPNLLFVGTDAGVFASFDRGDRWLPFRSNMAPAPVSDMTIQTREGDLVVGTYGRGIWVTNIVPLRGMGGDFLTRDAVLLPIRSGAWRHDGAWGNYRLYGDRYPSTPNEPNGISVVYYLKEEHHAAPTLTVSDASGKVVRKLTGTDRGGINRVVWNCNDDQGAPAPAGEYVFTLSVGGRNLTQKARLVSRAAEDSPRGGRGGGEQ